MIRLALRCRSCEAETVLAELAELAPGGVEEVAGSGQGEDLVEYAVYGAAGELPDIGALKAVAGGTLVEILTREVPDDWEDRWKQFYFPVTVAGRLYVRPPWESPAQRRGVEEVVIEPGRAFGTGTHATTRMCLELLVEARPGRRRELAAGRARGEKPRSFCDLGCGSGVLAIGAARLGYRPVLAVEADRTALHEAARNARLNGVEVELRHADVRREPPPVADLVAANLTAPLLGAVARGWAETGRRPGAAVVSGLLRDEADPVAAEFAAAGLQERRRLAAGEWAALLMTGA